MELKELLDSFTPPKRSIQLFDSRTDDIIPYNNSTAAKNKWNNATLTDLTSKGHINVGAEFIFRFMGIWEMMN